MTKILATNKLTGEVIDFDIKTEADLVQAYRLCSETIKAYDLAKKQLAKIAEHFIGPNGTSQPIDGYQFRHSPVQRMTYDKAVLRQVIQDEDTIDLLLVVDKKGVDEYLKEHLEELGLRSTILRESMIPTGKPYSVTRLEKL